MLANFPAFLALALTAGSIPVLAPDEYGGVPSLTLPGGPTIPMPPGAQVFGPHGFNPHLAPRLPDPAQPSAGQPSATVAPTPQLSPAERRKARVGDLLTRLSQAKDPTEAGAIGTMLDHLWLQSGSDTADLLMERALSAIGSHEYKTAEAVLDKVVTLRPDWPEAWNRRATLHYLQDDDTQSMADIGHVLALEPRHFGALSGMGFILHRNGDDKAALTVLRRAAAINPQDASVKTLIEQLTPEVEGHGI